MSEQKLTKQEATAAIAQLIAEAEAKIKAAEKIADASGVQFDWDGPTYGMGGWYKPLGWNDSGCEWESSDEGWQASAHSC